MQIQLAFENVKGWARHNGNSITSFISVSPALQNRDQNTGTKKHALKLKRYLKDGVNGVLIVNNAHSEREYYAMWYNTGSLDGSVRIVIRLSAT